MGKQVAHLSIIIFLLCLHCSCNLCHLIIKSCLAGFDLLVKLLEVGGSLIRKCGEHLVDSFDFILERLKVMLDKLLDLCPQCVQEFRSEVVIGHGGGTGLNSVAALRCGSADCICILGFFLFWGFSSLRSGKVFLGGSTVGDGHKGWSAGGWRMSKLLGIRVVWLEVELLFECVCISIQCGTGRFDIGVGGDKMIVVGLESWVVGEVLCEDYRKIITQPFTSGFKLTPSCEKKNATWVLCRFNLDAPFGIHKDFPD